MGEGGRSYEHNTKPIRLKKFSTSSTRYGCLGPLLDKEVSSAEMLLVQERGPSVLGL